ncbi:hypothetical protein G7046_g2543 [Stylonectria norvegica]|nr:hypothetical protein G7046_g2543 [Stylonectria norvegica]
MMAPLVRRGALPKTRPQHRTPSEDGFLHGEGDREDDGAHERNRLISCLLSAEVVEEPRLRDVMSFLNYGRRTEEEDGRTSWPVWEVYPKPTFLKVLLCSAILLLDLNLLPAVPVLIRLFFAATTLNWGAIMWPPSSNLLLWFMGYCLLDPHAKMSFATESIDTNPLEVLSAVCNDESDYPGHADIGVSSIRYTSVSFCHWIDRDGDKVYYKFWSSPPDHITYDDYGVRFSYVVSWIDGCELPGNAGQKVSYPTGEKLPWCGDIFKSVTMVVLEGIKM